MTSRGPSGGRRALAHNPVRIRAVARAGAGWRPGPRRAARLASHPPILAWVAAIAARYGRRLAPAPRPDMLLRTERSRGDTFVDRRTSHLSVAHRWAPRLQLTLVTLARAGARDARPSPLATPRPGEPPRPDWQLVGPILAVPPLERITHLRRLTESAIERRVRTWTSQAGANLEASDPEVASRPAGAPTPVDRIRAAMAAPAPAAPPVPTVMRRAQVAAPAGRPPAASPTMLEDETLAPARLRASSLASIEADPAAIDRISARVMTQIGHRMQAYRERTGRA